MTIMASTTFFLVLLFGHVLCENFELPIIHFNDFHARFEEQTTGSVSCNNPDECIGGIARLYTAIKQLLADKPESIFLNAGDNFQGTLWYNVFKWNVTQHFLNLLPVDAMTLGNHEFDDKIAGVVPFLEHITSPIVVTNIDDSLEPDMQGKYNKSTIVKRNGRKIGIVGVILSTTNQIASTGNLKFLDESASVNAEADRLVEEEGVFTVIVLSHSGYDVDQAIARNATSRISLVVGAHSHTFLWTGDNPPGPDTPYGEYPTVITRSDGHTVLVVQASAYTKYLGNITVYYDEDGEVVDWSGAPIYLENSIKPDTEITELLQPWKAVVDVQGTKVLGESLVRLSSSCYTSECGLGNFITDTMVYSLFDEAEEGSWTYAAIGITNAGGLRATLEAGNLTYGDLVTAIPFENTIDFGEIQGKYLKALFESTTYSYYYGRVYASVSLLQVSGLKIVYDLSQPEGSRVVSIKVRCSKCEIPVYEDLDDEEYYRIAVNSFLVTGGDGYTILSDNLQNHKVGRVDIDVATEYVEKYSPIYTEIEGRISFVDASLAEASENGIVK